MGRPRSADGYLPPLEVRRKIAASTGRRWHRGFWEHYREDAQSTVQLIALLSRKHMTPEEFRRFAGRVWNRTAKEYGFLREYAGGNRQGPWTHDMRRRGAEK